MGKRMGLLAFKPRFFFRLYTTIHCINTVYIDIKFIFTTMIWNDNEGEISLFCLNKEKELFVQFWSKLPAI